MLMTARAVVLVAGLVASASVAAQVAEPIAKTLTPAADPLKKTVLVGRGTAGKMIFQLELEGSEPMWMQMGNPPRWGAHTPGADERYHVELKLTDPASNTRISFANIMFAATNKDTGKTLSVAMQPMWGSSGLHYSENSALLGDGTYSALVTVDVPTFQRELKDRDLWSAPVGAKFHFKMKDGKLFEVSQPTT